jgi:error-prone DNA polymerase
MPYNNPPMPWSELEHKLSDSGSRSERLFNEAKFSKDGGDSPAWSQHRGPYVADDQGESPIDRATRIRADAVPYAELHAHSTFSFLDGASQPERLVETAADLGLHGLALTDHDGFYGAARFAEAATAHGVPTVFGAELSLGLSGPQNGVADPEGSHLLVLAEGQEGYHRVDGRRGREFGWKALCLFWSRFSGSSRFWMSRLSSSQAVACPTQLNVQLLAE